MAREVITARSVRCTCDRCGAQSLRAVPVGQEDWTPDGWRWATLTDDESEFALKFLCEVCALRVRNALEPGQ
jgi:hypothetical protein